MASAPEESVPEPVTQRKQADSGRFRLGVVLFNANVTLLGNYACYRQPVEDLALRLLFPSIHLESSFAEAASFVHFRSSKHPCCAKPGGGRRSSSRLRASAYAGG